MYQNTGGLISVYVTLVILKPYAMKCGRFNLHIRDSVTVKICQNIDLAAFEDNYNTM